MNRREEGQYPIEQRISQEEPVPGTLRQIIVALTFTGFIVLLPVMIERLTFKK